MNINIHTDTMAPGAAALSACMWLAWAGAIGMGIWSTVSFDPEHGKFAPQWVSFAFILLIGIAISLSFSVSRIKLARMITGAFTAGLTGRHNDDDERH